MVKWRCKSTLMNTGNGLNRCRLKQVLQTHQTKNTNIGVAKKNSRRDGFLSTCCIYFVIFLCCFLQFAELVERAGLSELFDHDPPYLMTLFAFNDTAYNNLPENRRNVFENYTKNQLADYIKFCTGKLLIYNIQLTNRHKTQYMFYPMNKRNLVKVQQ